MIVLVTAVEYGHRQILALALVPIGIDLGVSDTALGALLTGFGVSYAVLALAAGRLADRCEDRLDDIRTVGILRTQALPELERRALDMLGSRCG